MIGLDNELAGLDGQLVAELAAVDGYRGAGLVLSAKVPIILTSRADNEKARLASCAIAALYRAHIKADRHRLPEPEAEAAE